MSNSTSAVMQSLFRRGGVWPLEVSPLCGPASSMFQYSGRTTSSVCVSADVHMRRLFKAAVGMYFAIRQPPTSPTPTRSQAATAMIARIQMPVFCGL